MRRLMFFYRQLAQLVGSGVTIVEAIDLIARQESSARLKHVLETIRGNLAAGNSFADSCAEFPDIFVPLHVNIIRYSEKAGRISEGCIGLADYLEKAYALRQSLILGLAYPMILLHAAMVLLPVVNGAIAGPGGYLSGFLSIFLPVYGFFALIYLFLRAQHSGRFKPWADEFVLAIPWFGAFLRQIYLSSFIRALKTLCDSGVSIITGWRLAADACGNIAVAQRLHSSLFLLEQGQTLVRAFSAAGVFPSETVAMIASAEKSGSIVQTLRTIAAYSEQQTQARIAVMTQVLPMAVYFLVAGFIGLRIISFYAGYYTRLFK